MSDIVSRSDRLKNLVGFQVGDVRYAVDIFRVREIIHPLPLVELPHAPEVVIGVADHRGEVVPVVDLRLRFGLPPIDVAASPRAKWVIVDMDDKSVGLLVDYVTEVFGTGPSDQRQVPRLGSGDEKRGIAAVYMHDGALVFVIDVDRVANAALNLELPAEATPESSRERARG